MSNDVVCTKYTLQSKLSITVKYEEETLELALARELYTLRSSNVRSDNQPTDSDTLSKISKGDQVITSPVICGEACTFICRNGTKHVINSPSAIHPTIRRTFQLSRINTQSCRHVVRRSSSGSQARLNDVARSGNETEVRQSRLFLLHRRGQRLRCCLPVPFNKYLSKWQPPR